MGKDTHGGIPTCARGEANPDGRIARARRRSAAGEWPRAKIWSPVRGEVGTWPRGSRGANLGTDGDCVGYRGLGLGQVEKSG